MSAGNSSGAAGSGHSPSFANHVRFQEFAMTFSAQKRWARYAGALAIVLVATLAAPLARAADAAPEVVYVEPGTHKLLRLDAAAGRVAVGDPKVADVNLINGKDLLVNGKGAGVTSLIVWPRAGGRKAAGPRQYRISVGPLPGTDPELASMKLTPGAPIDGVAPSLMAHRRATQSVPPPTGADGKPGAAVADRSVVSGSSQVQSHVSIVEVNRTAMQQYGFNLLAAGRTTVEGFGVPGAVTGGSLNRGGANQNVSEITTNGFVPILNAFTFAYASRNFLSALSLLENRGLARTLAEPTLVAQSGQTASFLAGGEFPYPVPQGSGGASSTITIQFREYGVRLNLTPTVLSSDRISLKIAPEVSELDFANSVTVLGTTIPGLSTRRTDTTVELGDGESFVLSGLVSETVRNNVNKVPGLGDLPIIGAFFRSTSISRAEKELIMVVTPHLVRPIAKGAALPALPGESISRYRPNMAETIFLETGDFGQGGDSGYSK